MYSENKIQTEVKLAPPNRANTHTIVQLELKKRGKNWTPAVWNNRRRSSYVNFRHYLVYDVRVSLSFVYVFFFPFVIWFACCWWRKILKQKRKCNSFQLLWQANNLFALLNFVFLHSSNFFYVNFNGRWTMEKWWKQKKTIKSSMSYTRRRSRV